MTERVVVAGPYPTMPGREAQAMLALVRSLVREGADVTVVSPVPSAAHHHADPGGAKGALRLASVAAGADRLILRLDAIALRVADDSPRSLPGRLALALAMRRCARVEVILDRVPARVSGKWASLVLARADRITVASTDERDALIAAGITGDVINVEATSDASSLRTVLPSPELPATPTVHDLQQIVRSRAAAASTGATHAAGRASAPLRHVPPLERAPTKSGKPGVAFVKRLQARLLGWQFDWITEHVNKLHQATIEALEGDASQRNRGSDASSS